MPGVVDVAGWSRWSLTQAGRAASAARQRLTLDNVRDQLGQGWQRWNGLMEQIADMQSHIHDVDEAGNAAAAAGGNGRMNGAAGAGTGNNAGGGGGQQGSRTRHVEFPSFLAFFTSRYTVALILLSLVISRIHAVVRVNVPYRSSARVRAICRAPAIFLLTRASLLVIAMMLRMAAEQVSAAAASEAVQPSYYSLRTVLDLDKRTTHADVLWSCFIATCVACANESFIRALDNDLASITPINLFSLGLLLHYHSTPYHDPVVPPSRPVYFLILLQLGEILTLQIAAIPAWRIRLWITASFALVSRSAMVYFYMTTTEKVHSTLMPAIQSLGRILPEAFFVSCSLLTVALRGLVQLIVEGRLSKDIFGHASALPHRDDDFILALIKYGTAALETTALKGLNNEVSALSFPAETYVELHHSSGPPTLGTASVSSSESGRVMVHDPAFPGFARMSQVGRPFANEVRTIKAMPSFPADADPMSRNPGLRREMWRFSKALWVLWRMYVLGGLARKTGAARLAHGNGRIARSLRFVGVRPAEARSSISPSGGALAAVQEYLRKARLESDHQSLASNLSSSMPGAAEAEDDLLDDPDFVPSSNVVSDDESSASDAEESEEGQGDDEGDAGSLDEVSQRSRETTPMPGRLEELDALLDDANDGGEDDDEIATMLVAHLRQASSNGSPLTRRRYRGLYPSARNSAALRVGDRNLSASDLALSTAIEKRRHQVATTSNPSADRWDDNDDGASASGNFRGASICVVCCSEQRSIVLWPCRCLALCDDCRAELAARSTGQGGSSLCPCCRAPVQGFSRIMIP